MNITYQEYLAEVRSIAENAIEEAGEYEQDVYDTAYEAVDGHKWIIYYAYNDDVIRHSGNPDAWQDCYAMEYIGQLVVDEGMQGARAVQAYFALSQDVNEEVAEQLESRPFTQKQIGYKEW